MEICVLSGSRIVSCLPATSVAKEAASGCTALLGCARSFIMFLGWSFKKVSCIRGCPWRLLLPPACPSEPLPIRFFFLNPGSCLGGCTHTHTRTCHMYASGKGSRIRIPTRICRKLGLLGARCDYPLVCLPRRPRRCQVSTLIFRTHLDKSRTKLVIWVFALSQRSRGKRPKYRCFVIRGVLFAGARLHGQQALWTHLDKKSNKTRYLGLRISAP